MSKQSKQSKQSNYTDIRTGIVYTSVVPTALHATQGSILQPHFDAFIPPAFLKTYFGKEKSNSDSGAI
jgi:hypothetical protein